MLSGVGTKLGYSKNKIDFLKIFSHLLKCWALYTGEGGKSVSWEYLKAIFSRV
jgi:hypothetical protein